MTFSTHSVVVAILKKSIIVSVLVGLLTALCCEVSPSQTITWKDISGVPGCSILAEGDHGTLYAVTFFDSRYYSSSDHGLLWVRSSQPGGQIEEFVAKGNIVVASRFVQGVTNIHQVFLSTDAGSSWRRILSEPDFYYQNFSISDSGVVFAAVTITLPTERKIRFARYNGQGWDLIGSYLPFSGAGYTTATVAGPNLFIVVGPGGAYLSTDYAVTWTNSLAIGGAAIDYGRSNKLVMGVSADRSVEGGVFVSSDLGQHWSNLGLAGKFITSVSSDTTGTIFATTDFGIYRHKAGADTWEYVGPISKFFDKIIVTSSDEEIAASTDYGIFRSTDHGSTWSPNGPRKADIFALLTTPAGDIFTGTLGNRIFKSTNGGLSWQQSSIGSIGDYVYSLAFGGSTVYAGTDDGLYASTDNGETWENKSHRSVSGSAYAVVSSSWGDIFIGTNFGMYSSSDGGNTWTTAGLNNSKVLFLAASASGILYAATDHDGVFSSNDHGLTWHSRGLVRNDIQTIAVNPDNQVFIGVYGGIFHSSDDGVSWAQKTFTDGYVYALAFQGSQNVFAGTPSGVFVSDTGGNSWVADGLQNQSVLCLTFDGSQNLVAGAYRGGVYQSAQALTAVEVTQEYPSTTQLFQNYPNPFNPSTRLEFQLAEYGLVTLKLFNVLGEEVTTLISERRAPGDYRIEWDGSHQPSGVYFYRLQVDYPSAGGRRGFTSVKKMLLVR
ncbi:MAG: hypothetical protein HYR76_11100 [Ignavibacteria bacterium]|nr:hypothetical protein [Ignavibacteria bacterium]